jgi:hydroxyacylglutathione hydrolase
MFIQQIYTQCLAEASYYIECDGLAAVIDPIRETEPYTDLARARGARICYVFETHFHADFVSGHLDLSRVTGAPIVFGPGARTSYPIVEAAHGERFVLGSAVLEVLHTPGHTLESICLLLRDAQNEPKALFTGDTLFVGDVGRPDLAGENAGLTTADLAGKLYDSLQTHIMPLPGHVVVYPAHGAGSACGKNIGKETSTTLAEQKAHNYALQAPNRDAFVALVTEGLGAPPAYFFDEVSINRNGYPSIDDMRSKRLQGIPASTLAARLQEGGLVLDTREPDRYAEGHILNSINIGLNGQFAIWAATLLPLKQPLVLLTEEGAEEESVVRLARVGFSEVVGVVEGGIAAAEAAGVPIARTQNIGPAEFLSLGDTVEVIDVRNVGEQQGGMLEQAIPAPLAELERHATLLQPDETYYVHCAGGYRSMIAASLLERRGIRNVVNIRQGMSGLKAAGASLIVPIPVGG